MQKNIAGNAGFTQVAIPALSKGMSLMTFFIF